MNYFLNTLFFLVFWVSACSQPLESIDKNYYAVPVKIPVFLAGNFAELRPNHFHAGIDIKTQGKTGLPVFAAADGYISRISISPTGYGNVLYINHPNGTTTVYGHLESLIKPVQDYIRNLQYEKETFTIDQTVPEGLLLVKKGEQIAKSGNSGSSGGPHLHFEIRRTKEEIVLNPLQYNMPVKDKIRPLIQSLMIYPVSEDASVSGKQIPQRFETIQTGNKYQLKINKTIPVYGEIGFGIQSIDLLDGNPNKCGIYSIKLSVDNRLIYSFKMDELVMNQSKYVNSHMDYSIAMKTGRRLYRTWLEPGNKLEIYDSLEKRGIFQATDEKIHQVNYEVSDAYGNSTNLSFAIQSQKISFPKKEAKGKHFRYDRKNKIDTDNIEFTVPEGALYSDVDFLFETKASSAKFYSPVYQLHNSTVPLHFACPLRIKANNLPENLQSKVMLAQVDPNTGKVYSATGKYERGWVEGNIRVLGNYALVTDVVAPKITPLIFTEKKTLKDQNCLKLKVIDNLSGIESIRGTIDGKWVLFEYDLKNNLITYTFDKSRLEFNKDHDLNLEVTDFKENTSTYKTKFRK
jgi:hypothetical protein